ncbi:MAG: hypothetical protein Q7T77_05735 [Sulfuricurvum sp.]|nr:hypothetical protein [Sulfuricurvum sp.]
MIKIQLFYVLLLILGVADSFAAELSTKRMVSMIRPLEQYAMQYGDGDIKAYVFVDPKCPHSRDFISMIHDNEKMRGIYRYYIFFYELKRFNSHKLIGTIYSSSSPLQKMLEVMVGGKELELLPSLSSQVEEEIGDIDHVAAELGVNKRPYLIIAKEWN